MEACMTHSGALRWRGEDIHGSKSILCFESIQSGDILVLSHSITTSWHIFLIF